MKSDDSIEVDMLLNYDIDMDNITQESSYELIDERGCGGASFCHMHSVMIPENGPQSPLIQDSE